MVGQQAVYACNANADYRRLYFENARDLFEVHSSTINKLRIGLRERNLLVF